MSDAAPSYVSPIAPGWSFYEATLGNRPSYPLLDGETKADVAIVGGGFTGLQAALHLARAGVDVVLIDAAHFGDGASGRNGGQLGTGQREWPEDTAAIVGKERAQALFELAERAKHHLLGTAEQEQIDIEYITGQMSLAHKASYLDDYRRHAELMEADYGYPHISYMDAEETAERLGSSRYRGGIRDTGTGHINPLKLLCGIAAAAQSSGARLHEGTAATSLHCEANGVRIETPSGPIRADRALLACNAYIDGLEPITSAHVMPIRSFIGATVPLGDDSTVLPGGESVDDSRFVVRYFRRNRDGRLLFGGREAYTADNPRNISEHIRRQITEIYPSLRDVEITHAWGGSVGITMPREPFFREVAPRIHSIGGFSGHGVMLSNYSGKIYADMVLGREAEFQLMADFKVPTFPGGARFRSPLLFLALTWYSLRDRF